MRLFRELATTDVTDNTANWSRGRKSSWDSRTRSEKTRNGAAEISLESTIDQRSSSPLRHKCDCDGRGRQLWIEVLELITKFTRVPVTIRVPLTKQDEGVDSENKASATTVSNIPTTMNRMAVSSASLEERLRGALWSFMAGDALAAPTHWYYGGQYQVIQEYGKEITDYTKPNYNLPGSILNKSDMNGGGRSGYGSRRYEKTIIGDVINHGKQDLWSPKKSIHYHATLAKGENTLEVQIARVLMKSIVQNGGTFNADHFRNAYVQFMTTPGSHNDTYASTCHRMFFANLVHKGLDPKDCPDNDSHNVDVIDSLILPTIVAMAASCRGSSNIAAQSAECVAVTRRSSISEQIASQWAEVVHSALHDNDEASFQTAFQKFSKQTIRRLPNPRTSDSSTLCACYLSQSLPAMMDLIAKYLPQNNPWHGLLANANVGGENVHRGSVIGAILGARATDSNLPSQLKEGLYHRQEIANEIDAFVKAVLPKDEETKDEL